MQHIDLIRLMWKEFAAKAADYLQLRQERDRVQSAKAAAHKKLVNISKEISVTTR